MLGSKNQTTRHEAINIAYTVLEKWCDKKYPGIFKIYADLCESAHPNFKGMCFGYSYVNEQAHETIFKNRWSEIYDSENLEKITLAFMKIFEEEYNNVWSIECENLEKWLEAKDTILELKMGN